ncbi:MAG: squalene/phytoene synthase family protein [Candidatus Kapabacteria bacterium]|nr:squalene/phytoene synthase family protein [Candidatus Kapabacteria bacterium]
MKLKFEELKDLSNINSDLFSVSNLDEAYLFCKKLAYEHYENFPVGSFVIPSKLRKHFFAIYSYARIADDISDEFIEIESDERTLVLSQLKYSIDQINEIGNSSKKNPILFALLDTIEIFKIDKSILNSLLIAFQRDIDRENITENIQINNYEDLIDYCHYSANPIGELILSLFLENTKTNIELSNNICTALQLINFWQDLSIDLNNNRFFIPTEILNIYDINKESLLLPKENHRFDNLLFELLNFTEAILLNGKDLVKFVKPIRLKIELAVIFEAGMQMIVKCRKLGSLLTNVRPKLSRFDYFIIFIKTIIFHRLFI